MFNQDWDIKPRGTVCRKCEAPFADQQPYVSRLSFGEAGYDRSDFCAGCWLQQEQGPGTVSVWKGVFKAPAQPPEEPIKKETAESLLRRMMEENNASRTNTVFILAVMLERRRTLAERDVQRRDDGSRLRIYEHRGTGETFVIKDPMLRLDQLQQVQEEVMSMLSGQGSGAAAARETTDPASGVASNGFIPPTAGPQATDNHAGLEDSGRPDS